MSSPPPYDSLLGSVALQSTVSTLRKRIADFEAQTELAASTGFPARAVIQTAGDLLDVKGNVRIRRARSEDHARSLGQLGSTSEE